MLTKIPLFYPPPCKKYIFTLYTQVAKTVRPAEKYSKRGRKQGESENS